MGQRIALIATTALIALGLAWELWLAPTGKGTLAIKVLPLVLTLPGLMRDRLYTYRWLSLLVWLYVAEALVRVAAPVPRESLLALAQLVLCAMLFGACLLRVRKAA